jgi:hypothetical protein
MARLPAGIRFGGSDTHHAPEGQYGSFPLSTDGEGEQMSINLQAVPSFEAFGWAFE